MQATRRKALVRSARALAVHDDTLSHAQRRGLMHLVAGSHQEVCVHLFVRACLPSCVRACIACVRSVNMRSCIG